MYYVYILRSLKDKKLYVGLTADIVKRLEYHNRGKVTSTKSRIPFELLYKEVYATRTEAREREKYLKSYRGSQDKFAILERL